MELEIFLAMWIWGAACLFGGIRYGMMIGKEKPND